MTLLAAAPDLPPTSVENWISGFVIGVIAVLSGCLVAALVAKVARQATGRDGDLGSDLMSFVSDVKNFRVNLLIILSFARSIRPLLGIFTAESDTKTLDTAEFVFGAQLPMFGTWVGTDVAQIKLS